MSNLSIQYLNEAFTLGGLTGLIWKERPQNHFKTAKAHAIHITRNANKPAGCLEHRGYWLIGLNRKVFLAHRLVVAIRDGVFPDKEIDHIDRNKSNNKPSNLRLVTRSENIVNAHPLTSRSSTGVRNVYQNKYGYVVQVWKNGKSFSGGGNFRTLHEASARATQLKNELFGENCGR